MFQLIPNVLLKQLYTRNSLKNNLTGFQFAVKNRLADARFTGVQLVRIDGKLYPADLFTLELNGQESVRADHVSTTNPLDFPLRRSVTVRAETAPLPAGKHTLEITLHTQPFGTITLRVEDELQLEVPKKSLDSRAVIPRDSVDDTAPDIVQRRQNFLRNYTETDIRHIAQPSFDPALTQGNCEQFVGVAQVPIGLAGPLRINGEHAQGDFLIPLATIEGTLVASYNRGMKLLNQCGGVTCTVVDEGMQRAPVFELPDARAARDLAHW